MCRGVSVRELLATTGSDELADYEALELLDGYGERQADWRFACLLAMLHNCYCKPGAAKGPGDFIPELTRDREAAERQAEDAMIRAAMRATTGMGGSLG